MRLEVVDSDITRLRVDAVVNAANETLLGGGGVDGAIHAAAGPALLEACRGIGGCPTGEVRLTDGFRLPARHVMHTVGPVWQGGEAGEPELLGQCYQRCMELAVSRRFRSIAFPAISTGVYGYPLRKAAQIAVGTVLDFRKVKHAPTRITFCCFGREATDVYSLTLAEMGSV
ncbi:MAG: O-acetyl-ADP-ribose deacetylase [Minwuia sp.]|nr:O-acetyl-ADP-ribose deacetylase [Minwuia sp.]